MLTAKLDVSWVSKWACLSSDPQGSLACVSLSLCCVTHDNKREWLKWPHFTILYDSVDWRGRTSAGSLRLSWAELERHRWPYCHVCNCAGTLVLYMALIRWAALASLGSDVRAAIQGGEGRAMRPTDIWALGLCHFCCLLWVKAENCASPDSRSTETMSSTWRSCTVH